MKIPYDIIYKIYFFIDDYDTILSYFTLDEFFYNNYIKKYNKTYKHKFNIQFDYIFSFANFLPIGCNLNQDIEFLQSIQNIEYSSDINFIYKLYNDFLINQDINQEIVWFILTRGCNYINKYTSIIVNKNKLVIKFV